MRKLFSIALAAFLFSSCSSGQTNGVKTNLTATEFANKINESVTATIIDVRTPDEFSKGHLVNASNFDWNGNDFEKQIAPLDKSKTVFVYCLSGGRSENLPETSGSGESNKSTGMTKQEFDELLNVEKLVLIDFYADWCAPCIKMKPYLEEISKDMADKVVVIRINADDNQALCKELKIDALPVLHLYKNKSLTWTNSGFIDKSEVIKMLEK